MFTPQPPLLRYEKNVLSQSGEDGILDYALSILPACDKWCVEFGAWDGKYCSNTHTLIHSRDYSAVLIECDPKRCAELNVTHAGKKGIHPICRFIEFEGKNTLDNILSETPIPTTFDVLSIDIDGNDYYIWETLKAYRPKLVVIEFNPSIPNGIEFVQPRDMRVSQGCSLESLNKLARTKGYRLIHATQMNGIFVDEKYFELFGISASDPEQFRANLSGVTYIFHTYDGRIHLAGNRETLWHSGVLMNERRMQAIPGFLQAPRSTYNVFQKCAFKVLQFWSRLTRRK